MGEFIFKSMIRARGLEDAFYVESAAISYEEQGNPIYPPAKRCLTVHNIPFDNSKTARRIEKEDYDRFDLIICMDRSNLRYLERIIGEDRDHKVHLMMSYAGEDRDVADPWYTGDFETTYEDVSRACAAMLRALSA